MREHLIRVLWDHRFFPTVLAALDLCAAARYLMIEGEWRKVVYWLAAAALTTVVTW